MNELTKTNAEDILEQMVSEADDEMPKYSDTIKPQPYQFETYDDDTGDVISFDQEAYDQAVAKHEAEVNAPFTMPLPRNIQMNQLFLDDNIDILRELIAGEITYRLADEDSCPSFNAFQQTDKWLVLGLAMSEKNRKRFEVVWNEMLTKTLEVHEWMNRQDEIDELSEYEVEEDYYEGYDDDPDEFYL